MNTAPTENRTVRPPSSPPAAREVGFRIQHLLIAVLVAALLVWLLIGLVQAAGAADGLVLVLAFIGLLVVSTASGAVVLFQNWTGQQDALLWALAIAAERGMPLPATFLAFADQCGAQGRRRIVTLLGWLDCGKTLSESLRAVGRVLPRDAEFLVRVGSELGVLPAALREAVSIRRNQTTGWMSVVGRITYLLSVLIVMQTVLTFIAYFITPKFEVIFRSFGLPLPAMTLLVIELTHAVSDSVTTLGLAVLFVLAEFALLLFLPLAFLSWMTIRLPVLDYIFVRRHSALVLRALALAVEAQCPVGPALDVMALNYPAVWIAGRLRQVARASDRGEDWCVALRRKRLINNADLAVLNAARGVGNLPWALRQTAESGERRLLYRVQAWSQTLLPLLLLAVASLVFFLAVAYFSPLIQLVEVLAE